jgi:hypothetical protein
MSRISIDTLNVAKSKIEAMDLRQKELLLDEIFQNQPHLLGLVLVQQTLGVSLEKIDFLLNILLNCFQAMKESGLKWPKISEDEIERQMDRFVATVNFAVDLGSALQDQSIQQYAEGHHEIALLAYVQAETESWLKRIKTEESDKNLIIAAMTFVNCIASVRLTS